MTNAWTEAIARMDRRVDWTISAVTEGFPHHADPDTGEWTLSPAGDWTGGFWVGMLWLARMRTGNDRYLAAARRWAEMLRPRAESETVFRGFLFWYGAALGWLLDGDEQARAIAFEGARGFHSAYDRIAEVIPLGPQAEEASDVGRTDANIDGVPGGALLLWAAAETGDERLRQDAIRHALRHEELCVREDGSVGQSASFDPDTGEVLRRYTHKGYGPESTWTRAQSWAMVGYAMNAARVPEEPRLLELARRTCDWWLANAPADHVAYWDFDAPLTPETKRDTAGTAAAAAALLKLAALVDDSADSRRYRSAAETTVRALVNEYLTPVGEADVRQPGILTQGCYNHRIGLATESELVWGSYYLYEALHVLDGHLDPLRV